MIKTRFLNAAEASRQFGALAGTYAASLKWTDPLADAAVEALSAAPAGWWSRVEAALDGTANQVGVPAELVKLIESLPPDPSPETWSTMEMGRAAVLGTGRGVALALQGAAIAADNWTPPSTKALTLAGEAMGISVHPFVDTASLWIEVHKPGALRRGSDGYRALLRYRLIRAFERRIAKARGHWDVQQIGEPFNQGDLFLQVVLFTRGVITGFEVEGYWLTQEQKDAYHLFWRHAAAVLGLHKTYLEAVNDHQCEQFWRLWVLTSPGPDGFTRARAAETLSKLAATDLLQPINGPLMKTMMDWHLQPVGRQRLGLAAPRTGHTAYGLYRARTWLGRQIGLPAPEVGLSRATRQLSRAIARLGGDGSPGRLEALAAYNPAPPTG